MLSENLLMNIIQTFGHNKLAVENVILSSVVFSFFQF